MVGEISLSPTLDFVANSDFVEGPWAREHVTCKPATETSDMGAILRPFECNLVHFS